MSERPIAAVLAAPDKFRGTASATEVADAIASAVAEFGLRCIRLPLADGGEGLLDAFGGPNRSTEVTGPLGSPVVAGWRLNDDRTAVIESALASGLILAGGPSGNDAVTATSRGTGQLIVAAVAAGARRIIVGLGGSATTDGGRGAVDVLASHAPVAGPGTGRELIVCCDVTTAYVDAARVFAPQKGASPDDVALLTRRLEDEAESLRNRFGKDVRDLPGSGAAGGLAGALAALGATLVSGFTLVAHELGLEAAIEKADLIVTGEGMLDAQSFNGKVVGGVVEMGEAAGVPVLVIAGAVAQAPPPGVVAVSMTARFGRAASMGYPLSCVHTIVKEYLERAR